MKKMNDMRWFRSKLPDVGNVCRFGYIVDNDGSTMLLELCIDVAAGAQLPVIPDSLVLTAHDDTIWRLSTLRHVRTPLYPDGSRVMCVQVYTLTRQGQP
jgi:hypothetical protein